MTADAHSTGAHSTNAANDQDHDSESNNNTTTPIGLVADQSDSSVESLFASPLGPILQKAISESADEAGMVPLPHESVSYAPEQKIDTDYVLESRVTRAWVKKQRGPDGRFGPTWQTIADFALEVKIYKPPFRVPFWQGVTEESYSDPPKSKLLTPQDQTGIYDEPGQVLSIALTRAVASIFNRDDLRTLIAQDSARR
jgi:hypothetical protein